MKYENEPPLKDQDRESGSTTLKQCGWCEHASGSHRYNYCISGTCSLQKSYNRDVTWDKECVLKDASKSDIDSMISSHKYSIKSAEASIKSHIEHIETLINIHLSATERPSLPDDRKHDHFNIGEPIAMFYEDKWVFGEVRNGYRHHDGCVSYMLNGIGPQDIDKGSGYWGVGVSVPIIMLKSEYDFFKENNTEYKKWCSIAYDKSFNGETIEVSEI